MSKPSNIRAHIKECFPEIEDVSDKDLREKVVDVFQMALERSSWDDLRDVPNLFIGKGPMGKLVSHNRTVVQLCQQSVPVMRSFGHDIDEQLVLVGALLHDVGKIVEFGMKDGEPVCNERVRHSLLGAHMAMACGLSDDVAHIIMLHSWEGEIELPPGHTIMGGNVINWRTKEAMVVSYCDLMAAKILRREWHEERGTAPSIEPGVPFNE